MAIALDGAYPDDEPPGDLAAQYGLTPFGGRFEPQAERLLSLTDAYLRAASNSVPGSFAARTARRDGQPLTDSPVVHAADLDADFRIVKESFSRITANAEAAMEYFFSRLFVHYPEIRSMFPHAMRDHMEHVFAALAHIVWSIDSPEALTAYLVRLGRGHRKFGVKERHYDPFLTVLAETVRHFSGSYWTGQCEAAWAAALGHVSSVMLAAARQDAALQPAWWIGEVVQHDQRCQDLAVLTIRPDQRLHYLPGQYLAVQVPRWPRLWRNFSIANAPRENGLIDLHVRAVRGGMVSCSLVRGMRPGDTLLLGQACGDMTAPADHDRDLLCIAGGTGLAPLKAIIEEAISARRPGRRRKITLFFGARTEEDLYDLADLRVLEWIDPSLTVIPVVSQQPRFDGIKGMLPEVAARYANCAGAEVFISGPDRMVAKTVRLLASRSQAGHIRHDPPGSAI